ncbi:MAG: fibronectin type III domain-containing protein [Chloroflexi bacterium]|nr:fibronectin type III domain-containing protein [Chloroflexota bacterium]
MRKTSIVIAAFAAFALAFATLWQGAPPIAEAQQQESKVEITQVVSGDGRLQVDWTYSGDASKVKTWTVLWVPADGDFKGVIFSQHSIDKAARSFIIDRMTENVPLDNGVEYEVFVAERTKDGHGDTATGTGTPRAWAQPVITEVAAGKSRLEVSWTYDGPEIGLNNWAIVWLPTDLIGETSGDIGLTGNGSSRSFVIESFRRHGALRNGEEYTVYLYPIFGGEAIEGTESATATGVPMSPLPDVSPEITGADPYDGLAEINWTFDADYGDSFAALTGWKVCHRAEGKNDVACDHTDDPGARYHMINGLQNGKTYFVYAIPVFEEGREGNVSDDYQVALPKLTLPGAPHNMRVERKGSKYLLHWSPPEDDGGTAIFAYLWRGGSQRQLAEVSNANHHLDITRYLDNDGGVDRSRFYTFRVRAQNSQGRGPVATYTLRPQYFPPVIDSEVGRSEHGGDVVTVRWNAIEGAIKYRYNLRNVTSGGGWSGWQDVSDLAQSDAPFECFWRGGNPGDPASRPDCETIGAGKVGMHLSNLTPGSTYRIMVRAKTDEGVGPQSAKLKFVAGGRALQPQNLWAKNYSMEIVSDKGQTYNKYYVHIDWTKEYTGGAHDEGEYWQVRHNLSGEAGSWSRWITLAWIADGEGPLSGARLIRQTHPWNGDGDLFVGTHLSFPDDSGFIPGVSKFQVRRGHVNMPALSAISEVELKHEQRRTR